MNYRIPLLFLGCLSATLANHSMTIREELFNNHLKDIILSGIASVEQIVGDLPEAQNSNFIATYRTLAHDLTEQQVWQKLPEINLAYNIIGFAHKNAAYLMAYKHVRRMLAHYCRISRAKMLLLSEHILAFSTAWNSLRAVITSSITELAEKCSQIRFFDEYNKIKLSNLIPLNKDRWPTTSGLNRQMLRACIIANYYLLYEAQIEYEEVIHHLYSAPIKMPINKNKTITSPQNHRAYQSAPLPLLPLGAQG